MHAFGVCYGLCLQGLGQAKFDTNLLPREMMTERIIRAKKPWALATAAGLMLAFAINFFFEYNEWYKVHPKREQDGVTWETAMKEVDTVSSQFSRTSRRMPHGSNAWKNWSRWARNSPATPIGGCLWMEMLRAINGALPRDPTPCAPARFPTRR